MRLLVLFGQNVGCLWFPVLRYNKKKHNKCSLFIGIVLLKWEPSKKGKENALVAKHRMQRDRRKTETQIGLDDKSEF